MTTIRDALDEKIKQKQGGEIVEPKSEAQAGKKIINDQKGGQADIENPSPAQTEPKEPPELKATESESRNPPENKSTEPIDPKPPIEAGQTVSYAETGQPLEVVDVSDPKKVGIKNGNGIAFIDREKVINPRDLVEKPGGGYDYGYIDSDMAEKMKSVAGPIRYQKGFQNRSAKVGGGYGKIHTDYRHLKEIRSAKFNTSEDFMNYALNNFDEIWDQGNGTYIIIKRNGINSLTIVELARENRNFYTINTGWALSEDNWANYLKSLKKRGVRKVWEREASAPHVSGEDKA